MKTDTNSRLPFTTENKPNEDDIVLIYAKDSEYGAFHAGVVIGYENDPYTEEHEELICVHMCINGKETESSIRIQDIVWWAPIPLTKQELYSGISTLE